MIHTITPWDHFSPRTGSAIPTVVHGLASAAVLRGDARHSVVVERSTYRPRYDDADIIEYDGRRVSARARRYLDPTLGRLAIARPAASAYFRPLADAIRARPPAIVLAHNAPLMPWLLRGTEHRVVLYAHNELFRTYARSEVNRLLAPADAIICVSKDSADRTRSILGPRNRDKVFTVGNAVDTARFTPAVRPPRTSGEPMRVMFAGRVVRQKGADTLLRAAAAFDAHEIEVVVVGSAGFDPTAPLTAYERELRALAAQAAPSVTFSPFVDRATLPDLLRTADVLCVPSRWTEASGLTVGEGLATGIPVIASRLGGIPEALGPGGLLVPSDDVKALEAALRRLLDEPQTAAALGRAGREWVEAHDWGWAWERLREALELA